MEAGLSFAGGATFMAANGDLGDTGIGPFEKTLNLEMSALLLYVPIESLILSIVDSLISTLKLPI